MRAYVPLFALGLCAACDVQADGPGDGGSTTSDAGPIPTSDAAGADAAAPEAGPPTYPTFVAIGYEGRTTISCDDGKTWIANRSDADGVRCFDPTDCDHDGHAGNGLAYGNGWFVANFGWGQPGNVRRSRDGVKWDVVDTGSNFNGMTFANGRFYAAARSGKLSLDDGATWVAAGLADFTYGGGQTAWNVRTSAWIGTGFFLVADGPTAGFSADGTSWTQMTNVPSGFVMGWSGIVTAGGVSVLVSANGVAYRSADQGKTWTSSPVGEVTSRMIHDGTQFMVWGPGTLYRSKDGTTWTSTPTKITEGGIASGSGGPTLGPVERSPGGTFVAVNNGWQQWYEKQRFYRSTDGITWESLPSGAFTPSHPMKQIVWANVPVVTGCGK
jgi:hypothetical protein